MTKLVGYGAVFNELSEDLGGFREKIAPFAFARSLSESRRGIRPILLGHSHVTAWSTTLLARYPGSLELREDATGLRFSALVPDTTAGDDLVALVTGGIVTQMSFGFRIPDADGESWEMVNGELIRTLLDVDLFEVSLVGRPADRATSVSVRADAHRARVITAPARNVEMLAPARALEAGERHRLAVERQRRVEATLVDPSLQRARAIQRLAEATLN